MVPKHRLLFLFLSALELASAASEVATVAGSSLSGNSDGAATLSRFSLPAGLAATPDGARLVIADTSNHRIRVFERETNQVSTLAGSSSGFSDGSATLSKFNLPHGVAVQASVIYVCDQQNNRVRAVDLNSGNVSTIAGSGVAGASDDIGRLATFDRPTSIAVQADGSQAIIVDTGNNLIRTINLNSMLVSTLAGSGLQGSSDGDAMAASLSGPQGGCLLPGGTKFLIGTYPLKQPLKALCVCGIRIHRARAPRRTRSCGVAKLMRMLP
eukprot:1727177-Rhodomonas_salina.2